MTDVRIVYDNLKHHADIVLDGPNIELDDGLETAAIISVFSDRRAYQDDGLPFDAVDRKGWWGDAFGSSRSDVASVDDDRIGSRLWLLSRENQTDLVLTRAVAYVEECHQWFYTDGIIKDSEATAEWMAREEMQILLALVRPFPLSTKDRFVLNWNAQAARG